MRQPGIPKRCFAHKPAFNTFLSVFEYHSTPGLICGTQRVSAYSAMLPPLAFTRFSTNLQEALLQYHDLLPNRLSLVLTHDKPSQSGNADCITAHVNAKSALIQKHQKKELGVNLAEGMCQTSWRSQQENKPNVSPLKLRDGEVLNPFESSACKAGNWRNKRGACLCSGL